MAAPPGAAAPQLDLPAKGKSRGKPLRKDIPEELLKGDDGTVLGIKKPGTATSGKVGDVEKTEVLIGPDGRPVGTVVTTRENAPGQGRVGADGGLDLPTSRPRGRGADGAGGLDIGPGTASGAPRGAAGSPAAVQPPRAERQQPWELAPAAAPQATNGAAAGTFDPLEGIESTKSAARFLFDRLQKVRRMSAVETVEITDHLARLGEDGLRVARYCLAQDSDVLSYAGARTILLSGSAADADRVVQRLRGQLPKRSGPFILSELIDRDPVRASTPFLAQMLRHRGGSLRRVAQKELAKRLTNEDLSLLAPALDDRSTDVRKAATTLLAGLDDTPLVTEFLLERVVDRSTSVAEIAVEAVSRAQAGEPGFELLRRVFESGEIVRREALLILAVVEREDRQGEPIFGSQHTVALLRALDSPQPIVNAAAAVALAGLGFRSEDEENTPWLDGPVPSSLVSIATGSTFFDGFSLLREPALRRLRLISGVNFGSNGPDWAEWWGDHKDRFRADRAVITVGSLDATRIVLRVDSGAGSRALSPAGRAVGRRPYVLAGSDLSLDPEWVQAEQEQAAPVGVDVFFLTRGDSADLVALLSEEGVFGSGRLPGPRGSFGRGGRSIEIQVGRRSKSFSFSAIQTQPWFDRIIARAEGLAGQNAWQRFPVAGQHANAQDLFHSEAAWWSEERTEAEEKARFLALLLDHLKAAPVGDRDLGVSELEALVAELPEAQGEAVLDVPGTVGDLIELLAQETVFGPRARRISNSASKLIELGGGKPLRVALIAVLHDQFGPVALSSIAEVLQRAGRGAVLEGAVDDRETLRVAAALNLGRGAEPEDVDLLMALLNDDAGDVEIAAIASLAMRRASRARVPIWMRARASVNAERSVSARAAALRAVGMIGGAGALELLVGGLTDTDERFHLPAAEGMASLGTPETAALLVSLLRGSQRQSIQTVAKEGLLSLGEAAHDDLFSAMRSPDKDLQRDAAVLLAQQLVPRSVPVLASTVAVDPDDELAMEELAILTCVDYSDEPIPAERYFQWWDEVDHNNSFSWFAAALEQRGIRAPEAMAFEGQGTEEARLFLLTLVRELGGHMEVRALRELERLHGAKLGPVPVRMAERDEWFRSVGSLVLPDSSSPSSPAGRKAGD